MKLKLETKINAIVNVVYKSDLVILSSDLNCTFGDYVNRTIQVTKGEQSKEAGQRLFSMLNAEFKLVKTIDEKGKLFDWFMCENDKVQYQIITVR
jgi:hypothetical protein